MSRKKQHMHLQKAWQLISELRMSGISRRDLEDRLNKASGQPGFNIYAFARQVAEAGLPKPI
jgi:hypothetical protein